MEIRWNAMQDCDIEIARRLMERKMWNSWRTSAWDLYQMSSQISRSTFIANKFSWCNKENLWGPEVGRVFYGDTDQSASEEWSETWKN